MALKAAQACIDSPRGWKDTRGFSCQDYADHEYCTISGGYGKGWTVLWGGFSSYAVQNRSAAIACCSCGGGEAQASCCEGQLAVAKLRQQQLHRVRALENRLAAEA